MTEEELIKLSRENLRKSKQGSLCECYDEAFIKGYQLSEKCIAELEKENAELKEQNGSYEQLIDKGSVTLAQERLKNYKQLTKAKDIIKKFSEFVNNEIEYDPEHSQGHTDLWNKLCEQAEQFLNSEVEK